MKKLIQIEADEINNGAIITNGDNFEGVKSRERRQIPLKERCSLMK